MRATSPARSVASCAAARSASARRCGSRWTSARCSYASISGCQSPRCLHRSSRIFTAAAGLRVDLDDLLVRRDRVVDLAEEVELDVAAARVQIAEAIRARCAALDVRDRGLVELHRRRPALGLVADALHRREHVAVRRIGGERRGVRGDRAVDVAAVRAQRARPGRAVQPRATRHRASPRRAARACARARDRGRAARRASRARSAAIGSLRVALEHASYAAIASGARSSLSARSSPSSSRIATWRRDAADRANVGAARARAPAPSRPSASRRASRRSELLLARVVGDRGLRDRGACGSRRRCRRARARRGARARSRAAPSPSGVVAASSWRRRTSASSDHSAIFASASASTSRLRGVCGAPRNARASSSHSPSVRAGASIPASASV